MKPQHSYGALLRIGQISNGALVIEQGALPASYRLVRKGSLKATWSISDSNQWADNLNCGVCCSVPREYLALDARRVQARVNSFGVSANIPGVEVWMECTTSARRKG